MFAIPKTPSFADGSKNEINTAKTKAKQEIKAIHDSLARIWNIRLPSDSSESPKDRWFKSKPTELQLAYEIIDKINYLYFKANDDLYTALRKFDREATHLCVSWVHKPRADRDVIPETRHQGRHLVIPNERMELLKCLRNILSEPYEKTRCLHQSGSSKVNTSARYAQRTQPDDSPVAFSISSSRKHDGKHPLEPFPDINTGVKKAKGPETRASARESLSKLPPPGWNVSRPQNTRTDKAKMASPKGEGNLNMNTSFETNISSVFSQTFSSTFINSQSTDPDSEPEPELVMKLHSESLSLQDFDHRLETQSSDFGSSFDLAEAERTWTESFGAKIPSPNISKYDMVADLMKNMVGEVVHGVLDEIVEGKNPKVLERCLNEMLPTLPSCLKRAPFFVSYEITRIFLFLQVPMSEFTLPYVEEWIEYGRLWNMLKTLPILQDKKFPERCGAKVWEIAAKGYIRGFNGVVFTASLRENKKQSEPLLSFQLQPMKLDLTNRLERRFGCDRFFEFEIPDLESKGYRSTMAKVDPNAWDTLKSWLVNKDHLLLGRTYKSFFVKIKDRRKKSSWKSDAEEESSATPFRAFLFATDGYGFVKESRANNLAPHIRVRMTLEELLNCIRPTSENKNQPYMKLFARTALVLSRNQATVTVERTRIRYKEDIRNPNPNDPSNPYVMTDGAGKMSLSLARKIVFKLELSYIPSAFQGRFGEAKGLWIVDRNEDNENDWIELYREQFVGHSTPLKTADLNTQLLPLLMHQATDPKRSWIRPTNSSIQDKIKTGAIQWRGGLPAKLEDRINILLDAGFDPCKSSYLMELAKKSLKMKCDDLKSRLNITVSKSTTAYMVPDFWGVLEPNEIHLGFSSFVDNETGLSDTQLEDVDVLVARNPAHYPSDIQRVTAVSKHELRHFKDIIFFSIRGYPSLADKLSGGDYDGDKAWICWDPAIVESFTNADIPKIPNLVKNGFIKQDKTTYAQLTKGHSDPTNIFLRFSFDFNMHQSMLGYSTVFKEDIAYMLGDLNRPELIFLSTLLSNLVDQPKQGFIFTEKDLDRVKAHITATTGKPFMPQYKTDKLLTNLTNSIKSPPEYDPILAQLYKNQRDKAKVLMDGSASLEEIERAAQWKLLLDQLDEDVHKIKIKWVKLISSFKRKQNQTPSKRSSDPDETSVEFAPMRDSCFEDFLAIKPHASIKLILTWLDQDTESEFGQWALLRASALYASYAPRRYYGKPVSVSNLIWWMAGKQYAFIKANQHGMIPVSDSMYVMLKANTGFVRQLRAHEGLGGQIEDSEDSDLLDDD
ncbi:hypothetical protein EYC80_009183 [Monilinia laxa]|uniref:RNA-dependent RNA polymerase n=1 Tax=Monilinia laxa TaxID=61186 RepID=A0A5N6K2V3_MONLA|nr:hypothetical protein EYC80_009183 [Monilinia laxa]